MSSRLLLRPGTPVMARGPGVLQVGLDGPVVQLPDQPATRDLLSALGRFPGVPHGTSSPALDRLDATGLLVVVPDSEAVPEPADQVLRAQFGPDAVRRRAARSAAAIVVRAAPGAEPLLGPLLAQAGLRRTAGEDGATAHLVVSTGPLDRERLDPLVRSSIPHLVVSGGAGRRRVGPFVHPGHTACLRCVDAHEALHDARRPFLVAQAARAAAERPPPLDPVLDALALAWAVRDLARYVEGDSPSTWSTTFDIGPTAAPAALHWGRHPDCGCAWDAPTLFE
ncbi:hypothetical protein CFH99_08860 [Nocardioides aromaticivorans]|uniref:Bacteriocin biosynthesis cyclodehydratase domain-containing protein n=1 Tax=Nocardioides aromaticivorans TaxID=200618 RepID=A0ABX7PIZ3_9ACTN|nr:hypothetical protein [Nocardioides aromaticivorans]QSR25732.1 hypothetical protein CFH99_08860 [Nocardioides aromaticivorans]